MTPIVAFAIDFVNVQLGSIMHMGRPLRQSPGFYRDFGLALFKRDHAWVCGVAPTIVVQNLAFASARMGEPYPQDEIGGPARLRHTLEHHPAFLGPATECNERYGGEWLAVRVEVDETAMVNLSPAQQMLFDLTDEEMRVVRRRLGFPM